MVCLFEPRLAVRAAETAVVEGEHAVGPGEVRHLLPPHQRIAAGAVGEDQRRPVAAHFVVDLGVWALDEGHRVFSATRGAPGR